MANILFENKFVTAFLQQKITLEQLHRRGFDAGWLKHNADLFQWLIDYLNKNDRLPEIDLITTRYPTFYLTECEDSGDEIIQALNHNTIQERLYVTLQQAGRLLQEQKQPVEVVKFLKKSVEKLDLGEVVDTDTYELSSPDFTLADADYLERRKAFEQNGIVGIPTGLGREFDSFVGGGFQKQQLYGAIGISGVSKSWQALMHLLQGAFMNGHSSMYFALEGIPSFEFYRTLTVATQITNTGLMTGALPIEEYQKAKRKFVELSNKTGAKFWLSTFGKNKIYTPEMVHDRIVTKKPKIAVVDYAQMMAKTLDPNQKWQQLLEISKDLKTIAGAEDIALIAILQSDMMALNLNELDMSNIGMSKGMIRDFDTVWGITKVKGMQYVVRMNSVKTRWGDGNFKALYRTNWDTGKMIFEQHVDEQSAYEF